MTATGATRARPPRSILVLVVVAVVLLGLNLRTAVAALSPVLEPITGEIGLTPLAIGVLGMVPPIIFALSGPLAPRTARGLGTEWTLVAACAAMVVGPLLRAIAPDFSVLLMGTVCVLLGAGFANILLPAVVKKYYPDRIGALTATYATLMAVGAAISPSLAVPVVGEVGWRVWLGLWAIMGAIVFVPWFLLALRSRRSAAVTVAVAPGPPVWRSGQAWAMVVLFFVPTIIVYSMFAWLPEILVDVAGVSDADAGLLLGVFALMGLPAGLIIPLLVARLESVRIMILVATALFVVGLTGLLVVPDGPTLLWAILIGSGPLVFPMSLTLFTRRTRSHAMSARLSGFVQAIGYGGGALGPLMVALLHGATGGWAVPIAVLLGISLLLVIPAIGLGPHRTIEDDLEGHVA